MFKKHNGFNSFLTQLCKDETGAQVKCHEMLWIKLLNILFTTSA